MRASVLAKKLLEDHRIFTVAIEGAGLNGCRITPNVFTTEEEIHVFSKALLAIADRAQA